MPKYLIQASYTAEGLQGLIKDKASGRRAAVSRALEAIGGKTESIFYTCWRRPSRTGRPVYRLSSLVLVTARRSIVNQTKVLRVFRAFAAKVQPSIHRGAAKISPW